MSKKHLHQPNPRNSLPFFWSTLSGKGKKIGPQMAQLQPGRTRPGSLSCSPDIGMQLSWGRYPPPHQLRLKIRKRKANPKLCQHKFINIEGSRVLGPPANPFPILKSSNFILLSSYSVICLEEAPHFFLKLLLIHPLEDARLSCQVWVQPVEPFKFVRDKTECHLADRGEEQGVSTETETTSVLLTESELESQETSSHSQALKGFRPGPPRC